MFLEMPSILSEKCTKDFCNCFYTAILTFLLGYSPDDKYALQKSPEPEAYDFIIVGAGPGGCVVANRLSEINDWKILLLEAGKEEPIIANIPGMIYSLADTEFNWRYKTQPEKSALKEINKEVWWPRGKSMGGTSALGSIYYVRGNREDYDNWDRVGNPGWSYKDVLPYFKKSENNMDPDVVKNNADYHGTGGYLSVETFPFLSKPGEIARDAFLAKGYNLTDINGFSQIGVTRTQVITKNNSRSSANKAFIRPIREERKNLFIKTQSFVTKILIDPETKTATGVEYICDKTGETKTARVTKEVIVSGGVINSPQLLMNSGLGPKEELEKHKINVIKDLSVGKNLHDHVSAPGLSAKRNITMTPPTCDKKLENLLNYLTKREGPLIGWNSIMVTAFGRTKFEKILGVPDMLFTFDKIEENTIALKSILLTPTSRGHIALNETDPVRGKPYIYAGYFTDKYDIKRLVAGLEIIVDILNSTVMRENGYILDKKPVDSCKSLKFNTYNYWLCFIQKQFAPDYHFVGSCKMGPENDTQAVVDSRLRVHGIKGLRVIDSSIMPIIIRGNTIAPTLMIGEKGSDMIKQDWSQK